MASVTPLRAPSPFPLLWHQTASLPQASSANTLLPKQRRSALLRAGQLTCSSGCRSTSTCSTLPSKVSSTWTSVSSADQPLKLPPDKPGLKWIFCFSVAWLLHDAPPRISVVAFVVLSWPASILCGLAASSLVPGGCFLHPLWACCPVPGPRQLLQGPQI